MATTPARHLPRKGRGNWTQKNKFLCTLRVSKKSLLFSLSRIRQVRKKAPNARLNYAPWDAAKPGDSCLSVSVHRDFQAELARANSQHMVTLFLDLTTFYETITHWRLEQTARELEYPATLLNIALQVCRGARVLTADLLLTCHLLRPRCGGRVPHCA